jgi:uncharacterized protein
MKISSLIIFLSIVLSVYALVNFYIFIRGWQALPAGSVIRKIYLYIFILVSLSFIIGRVLERFYQCPLSDIFVWIGSFWFAAILYFLILILIFDITRSINTSAPIYPAFATFNYEKTKQIVFLFSVLLVGGLLLYGYYNAKNIKITKLDISLSKNAGELKELKIAMLSDMHLGNIISNSRLEEIVEKTNSLNPDIILLAGDIVDEDLGPVIKNNLGEMLRNFKSKYGTYGITGNHEYIGGVEEACSYLNEHNITMLRDTAIKIDNSFYLIGREDRDISRMTNKRRKSLAEILKEVDKTVPLVLMNHQPSELDETIKNEIDVQFSGHTHHGQLFPLNYITNIVFEISKGYLKKGQTHFYVSNGVGTWGPPVRIGNSPEIVEINIKFGY